MAAAMSKATTLDAVPPKAVQRWSAADYAKNGRFVQEMAGAVFAMLAPKPGERVLDLGCGDGALTEEIKAAGANVLGVDLSDELLAVARMKGLTAKWTAMRWTSSPNSTLCSPMPAALDAQAQACDRRRLSRAPLPRPLRGRARRPRKCRCHRHR